MPKDFPARGMYHNATAFEQGGVAPPPTTFADQTWTWAKFLNFGQRLTRDRGGVTQFGWTMGTAFREWMVWVYGNGGEFVSKDATECALHEGPAVDALQFLQDVRFKQRLTPGAPDAQQGASFERGRVAMVESGPFAVGNFRRLAEGFTWDASPMPHGPTGKYATTGGGSGQGAGVGGKFPDEAWELLKFVMSPEALFVEIVKDHLNMPARKSLATSKEYLASGLPPKNMKVFVEGLGHLRLDPQTTNWGEISAATAREMMPLWSGERSARDVAQAVKRVVDPLLKAAEAKRRL